MYYSDLSNTLGNAGGHGDKRSVDHIFDRSILYAYCKYLYMSVSM